MPKLTREDVTVHTMTHPTPMPPWHIAWHVEVAGEHFQIVSRPDEQWGKVTDAFRANERGWTIDADADLLHESRVCEADHWACIDRLLAWLSIDVEDGWSRPVDDVSHRLDLGLVDIVALFTTERGEYSRLWTIRDFAKHRESYRYDEGEYDLAEEIPAALFVRRGADLLLARYTITHLPDRVSEVRVLLDRDGELVCAARY